MNHNDLDDSLNGLGGIDEQQRPLICGFIALVRLFLCVVDLLSSGLFPGAPPQAYAMTSGSLRSLAFPESPDNRVTSVTSRSMLNLTSLLHIIKKLQSTLQELPDELKITTLQSHVRSPDSEAEMLDPTLSLQFDIMRANIHITSLYIQSTILEACSSAFASFASDAPTASPEDDARSSPGNSPRTQLWKFRESIACELLDVLNFCSTRTLEANGSSMVSVTSYKLKTIS